MSAELLTIPELYDIGGEVIDLLGTKALSLAELRVITNYVKEFYDTQLILDLLTRK